MRVFVSGLSLGPANLDKQVLRLARNVVEEKRNTGICPDCRDPFPKLEKCELPVTRPQCKSGSQHPREMCKLLFATGSLSSQIPAWRSVLDARALSSAVKSAVVGVGKRSKDGAGASIDRLTNVHGEGENNDKKEEIDAKQRMQ